MGAAAGAWMRVLDVRVRVRVRVSMCRDFAARAARAATNVQNVSNFLVL